MLATSDVIRRLLNLGFDWFLKVGLEGLAGLGPASLHLKDDAPYLGVEIVLYVVVGPKGYRAYS